MLCAATRAHHAALSPHITRNCLLMLCLTYHLSAVMARSIRHTFFDVRANKITFGLPVAVGHHSILEIREAVPGIFDVIIQSSGTAQDTFKALCTDHTHHGVHLLHFLLRHIWPMICDALPIAHQDMYSYPVDQLHHGGLGRGYAANALSFKECGYWYNIHVRRFGHHLATPSDTGTHCASASPAPSNNGLHDDAAPDDKHDALCPATPVDSNGTPLFAPFFPLPREALPATQRAVYAAHGITNLEDTPDLPLHTTHTPPLSAMHHVSPDATPPLNPDAFGNELAAILDTYHVLDTALLNSAPRAPPQTADSAPLHAHPEHPQPPAELPATCAPATSPGPASALQDACHCNTLAKHIVLCSPACPHVPGFDDSTVLLLPVQTPAIHGLCTSPAPHCNATAVPPASAPWASCTNTVPHRNFILRAPPSPQSNHSSNVEILPSLPRTLTRHTRCTCYGANPHLSDSNATFNGASDNLLDLSVSCAPSTRPSTSTRARTPSLDTTVLRTYPPLKCHRQSLQDQSMSMSSSSLSHKHPRTLVPEHESAPLPPPAPAAPCAAEPATP
jgi:hypothetical protein